MNISALPSFAFSSYQKPPDPDIQPTSTSYGVKHTSSWSYCGPLLEASSSGLPPSFHTWSASSIKGDFTTQLLPFLTYANDFLHANHLFHYWITIRATRPNDEFIQPRWHTDDLFYERYTNEDQTERSILLPALSSSPSKARPNVFSPNALAFSSWKPAKSQSHHNPSKTILKSPSPASNASPTSWKLITTLLGPPTLLISMPHQSHAVTLQRQAKHACGKEHVCSSIRCVGCSTAASHVREQLNLHLRHTPTISPKPGEAVFLRVGHDVGAIHSEPDESVGDRIFVNVVPGREIELKRLMAKWGMEFPRHWAVVEGELGYG